jgi:signal transduction histidine kinase
MSAFNWRLNTLAGWLMVNIVFAILMVTLLNVAVIAFASVWARPDLVRSGLLKQMDIMMKAVAATPAADRPRMAAAISDHEEYGVHWYATRDQVPMPPTDKDAASFKEPLVEILGQRRIEPFDPYDDDPEGRSGQTHYMLAVQMDDGSWVTFDTATRIWGVHPYTRYLVIGLFVMFSSMVVAAVASRHLSRPMRRLAAAAERFGADVKAPPIRPEGPQELRVAMRAFNEMQGRIQRFVRDRTDMLAAISHDLRAPLTRIRLRGEYIDEAEQQRKLFADVDEMRSMIDAALAFFRGDGEEEAPTRFDLAGLVQTVIDDGRDEGGEVTYAGPVRLIYEGRPIALKRAIANLLGNAMRYGGQTRVELDTDVEHVRLRILDNGPGIPESLQETVFRPFFRGESSRNRNTGGVGLGLPTARSIVRGHGGDVVLGNTVHGLAATLLLPIESART